MIPNADARPSAAPSSQADVETSPATPAAERAGTSSTRFPRPVVCSWCGNRYRSAITALGDNDDHTQGDCCAATAYRHVTTGEWRIQGFYGSTNYDTDVFRFVKNAPTERAEVVCDNCIGERLCAGDIEQTVAFPALNIRASFDVTDGVVTERRLDLSPEAAVMLARAAAMQGVTVEEVIERTLDEADGGAE